MRVAGTEAAKFQRDAKRTDAYYEKKKKKANWRAKHEEFINAIRTAKAIDAGADPKDLPQAPPTVNPDYVTVGGADGCVHATCPTTSLPAQP